MVKLYKKEMECMVKNYTESRITRRKREIAE